MDRNSEAQRQLASNARRLFTIYESYGPRAIVNFLARLMMAAINISEKIIRLIRSKAGLLLESQVQAVCDCLNRGGVVAIPTDTIYGLAAKVDDSKALKRIYQIKKRDSNKPLAVCVPHIDDIGQVAQVQDVNPKIISCLLPGPITILLKRSKNLNPDLNPGVETVGVRVIDDPFVRVLGDLVGPIALTSANRSGEPNPTIVGDFTDLAHEIDCIVDGSQTQKDTIGEIIKANDRLGSTVVDLTRKNCFSIVREGCALNRTIAILNRLGLTEYKAEA